MSYPRPFDIATGGADGWRSIKIEGRNTDVAQSFVPISPSGVYQTPQAGNAVQLRIRAGGNANDTAAGLGAREVLLYGIDQNGFEITDTIVTAGASASLPSTRTFIRLLSARVSKSGRYANQTTASHFADINIESTSGAIWGSIPLNGFGESISRIGAFTVPIDYEAYLIGIRINAAAGKTVDAIVFKREGILKTSPPYDPMVVITSLFNLTGFEDLGYDAPIYLPPLTDIGIMAVIDVQTARVGCGLGLLLRRVM
jgi:hypothetical protein